MGVGVAVASVAVGASVIEKHFTLCRDDGGVDSEFSLEPNEFKSLVQETYRAWQSLGRVTYGSTEAEKKSLVFRRSIYVSEDIKKGQTFTTENLRIIRPGLGAPPSLYNSLIGKYSPKAFSKGQPLTLEDIVGLA